MEREFWITGLHLPPDLTDDQIRAEVVARLRLNKYMGGTVPTAPQVAFLLAPQPEVLYGGAAGGGKSVALLLGALQYVDIPGYAALIVRRTYQQLSKPGALMSMAREWLAGTDARWDGDTRIWHFPRGSYLAFGHIENPGSGPDNLGDEVNFQGSQYHYIAIDEPTQFPTAWPFLYLQSRNRRLLTSDVPARMRLASNPGGIGHAWVKDRFIGTPHRDRLFIPAKLTDNPHLDQAGYLRALNQLDPVTRAQLRDGDWTVEPHGDLFLPERIRVLAPEQIAAIRTGVGVLGLTRYWDKAGTEGGGAYTAGVLMARVDKTLYGVGFVVVDIIRGQWSPGKRNMIMRQAAGILRPGEPVWVNVADPRGTVIWIEQEPGSGGLESAQLSVNDLAGPGIEVRTERATGQKADRARPFAAQVEGWNVGIAPGAHVAPYLDELRPAPNGLYWDQIDASSGAYNKLAVYVQPALPASSPGTRRTLALPSGAPADPWARRLGVGVWRP